MRVDESSDAAVEACDLVLGVLFRFAEPGLGVDSVTVAEDRNEDVCIKPNETMMRKITIPKMPIKKFRILRASARFTFIFFVFFFNLYYF